MIARYFLLLLIICTSKVYAFEVPALTGPVMDLAEMIAPEDERALDQALRAANNSGQIQLQILTVVSLNDMTIEDASYQIAKTWRLGGEKSDNGVLFLVSKNDRRLRIEVGQGLEGQIPDIYAKRIVSDIVIPYFREGRTSDGIRAGTAQILKLTTGEVGSELAPSQVSKKRRSASGYINIIVFILIFIIAILKPRRRTLLGLGGLGGFGSGRGGFGGGFGGGGGGWSGGGGGFSGGGASGGW